MGYMFAIAFVAFFSNIFFEHVQHSAIAETISIEEEKVNAIEASGRDLAPVTASDEVSENTFENTAERVHEKVITQSATDNAFLRVNRFKILRCAYAPVEPYIYKDIKSGKVSGPIADIMKKLGELGSVDIEWTAEVSYADFAQGLNNGDYDAFCGVITATPAREEIVTFTKPLYKTPYYIYVRDGDGRFKSLDDMNSDQVTVATIAGESFQYLTRQYLPNAKELVLEAGSNADELFDAVKEGRADIVIHDPLKVMTYKAGHPDSIHPALARPIEIYPMSIAVGKEQRDLKTFLDAIIHGMHGLGGIDRTFFDYNIDHAVLYRFPSPVDAARGGSNSSPGPVGGCSAGTVTGDEEIDAVLASNDPVDQAIAKAKVKDQARACEYKQ